MKKGSGLPQLHWRRIGLGTALGMLTTLVLTGSFAALMQQELLQVEWSQTLAVLVLLLSGFASGTSSLRGGTILETGLAATGYFLLLLAIHAGLFEGSPSGVAVTLLAILGGWGCSVLLVNLGSSRRSHRRRKRRSR